MLNKLRDEVHTLAREKGWYDGEERKLPELIALMHSELSEVLEDYRDGREISRIYYECKKLDCDYNTGRCCSSKPCEYGKPCGIPVELADCIIRILDCCGYYGIDIDGAIQEKHSYNKTRPYRHNGKVV